MGHKLKKEVTMKQKRQELEELYAELAEVEAATGVDIQEYLRKYNCDEKAEIVGMLKESIDEVEREISAESEYDYTEEELEAERTQLCLSQGLSRWC